MTKERKIILGIGLILLLAAAVYRFYPEINLQLPGQEIALKKKMILKYRRAIQEKNDIEARHDALNKLLVQAESGLLVGGTPVLAAVDIQNLINRITRNLDIQVQSIRVIKAKEPEEGKTLQSIPVRVKISSSVSQVFKLVYQIETSDKILKITNFRLRINNPQRPDRTQCDFTVRGVMRQI